MEFKLHFPTLQDLAVLEIAHSLMDLEVNEEAFLANKETSLRESLSKVDKLEILDEQKCRIKEVLKGTSDHLHHWFTSFSVIRFIRCGGRPKLQFDVHGCVDEMRMSRDVLQKCLSEEKWNRNLKALKVLLHVASYYVLLPDIQEIFLKILKLRSKGSAVPQLKGPEFEIDTDEKLCLVYRFVDQQGTLMSLNVDYFDNDVPTFSTIRGSNSCVRITLHHVFYNSEMCQLHWNLLEPAKRISFVKNLMVEISSQNLVNVLHFLDPDSRRWIVGKFQDDYDNYAFFCCFLVWPYQELFLPALQLVKSMRELRCELILIFEIIVHKLDMVVFNEILCPVWEAISLEVKSDLSGIITFKDALRELSRKNVPMYKRISADLNLPLTYLQESRKEKTWRDFIIWFGSLMLRLIQMSLE